MSHSQHQLRAELGERIHGDLQILDFLLDEALDGLWYHDLESSDDGWVSPGFWRLLGVDQEKAPAAREAWQSFVLDEDRERLQHSLEDSGALLLPPEGAVFGFRRVDGAAVWSHCKGRRLDDPNGSPRRLLIAHRDVTGLRSAQRAALCQEKKVAVGQLTAGVAHELNNNLSAVLGNAELLLDDLVAGVDHAELEAFVRDILEGAARGATLITGLMRYARSSSQGLARTNIADEVESIVALLRRSLGSRITLILDMQQDLGEAMVDGDRLQTALVNLALNAKRALDDSGEIRIEARRRARGDGAAPDVELAVVDQGRGMSKDILASCTTPFFTTHPDEQAAGLGLSAVLGFVHQAGGELRIDSKSGEGTSVLLSFPPMPESS